MVIDGMGFPGGAVQVWGGIHSAQVTAHELLCIDLIAEELISIALKMPEPRRFLTLAGEAVRRAFVATYDSVTPLERVYRKDAIEHYFAEGLAVAQARLEYFLPK